MSHYKTLIDTTYVGQWDLPERDVIVTIAAVGKYEPEQRRKKKLPDGRFIDEPRWLRVSESRAVVHVRHRVRGRDRGRARWV